MKKRLFQSKLVGAGFWVWLFGCGPYLGLIGLNKLGIAVSGNADWLAWLMIVAGPLGFVLIVIGIALSIFSGRESKNNHLL